MKTFISKLKELGACKEAIKFASKYDTLQEAWMACKDPSYLFWLISNKAGGVSIKDRRKLSQIAAVYAGLALPIYEAKHQDLRVRKAVKAAQAGDLRESRKATLEAFYAARAASDEKTAAKSSTAYYSEMYSADSSAAFAALHAAAVVFLSQPAANANAAAMHAANAILRTANEFNAAMQNIGISAPVTMEGLEIRFADILRKKFPKCPQI
jgi:hypothetical protein